jgi:putative cardiolipin synthase
VTGGRNIGDEYFQASGEREFGDFDLRSRARWSRTCRERSTSSGTTGLAIPVEAQPLGEPIGRRPREGPRRARRAPPEDGRDFGVLQRHFPADQLADILSGKRPLVWAKAILAYDSPDKASIVSGDEIREPHLEESRRARPSREVGAPHRVAVSRSREAPTEAAAAIARAAGCACGYSRIRSASTDMPIVHAGYRNYRVPLLQMGVELYEVRKKLGEPETKGGSIKSASSGSFALHREVFVFDRERAFVGSMNFDPAVACGSTRS